MNASKNCFKMARKFEPLSIANIGKELKILIMKKKIFLIVIALSVIIACNNEGKDKDSVEKADSANKAQTDTAISENKMVVDEESSSFLVKAADGGMAEVQLGELGKQKAMSQRVKNFSDMMMRDHTVANDKVKSLAGQKNVTLPTSVSDENQKKMDRLNKKTGKDFDRDYMDVMVKDHETTINMFESAMKNTKDPDVNSFADKTLPTLRMHLDSAKAVRSSLKH
jgi:putative membrane protein